MNRIRRFCSHEQHYLLDKIHELALDFALSNDNSVTYALTGLLSEITNPTHQFVSFRYLREKLALLETLTEQAAHRGTTDSRGTCKEGIEMTKSPLLSLVEFTTHMKRRRLIVGSALKGVKPELYMEDLTAAAWRNWRRMEPDVRKAVDPVKILLDNFGIGIVHELLHYFGAISESFPERVIKWLFKLDREDAHILTLRKMGWDRIKCPAKGEISFDQCFACDDVQATSNCPLLAIRTTMEPRPVRPGEYHVTELTNIRHAFFERTISYAKAWDEALDFWWGTAAHKHIQSRYGKTEIEIFLSFTTQQGLRIVGSADVVDIRQGFLLEIKTYATTRFILMRNVPEEDHLFQAQSYYALGMRIKPWLFSRVRSIKIPYLSKTKSAEHRVVNFDAEPCNVNDQLANLSARAKELDEALKKGIPPSRKCTAWLCNLCEFQEECKKHA